MADLFCNKLLDSPSFNSCFPLLSLPLSLSPRSNYSTIRFTTHGRRFSHSSVLTKLSSDSIRFDIISTTEHSDGTVVFKFADASEIPQRVENVELNDTNLEQQKLKLESESVSASVLQAPDVINADNLIDNDPKSRETAKECNTQVAELAALSGETSERLTQDSPHSLIDSQSVAQSDGDSVDDVQSYSLISITETEDSGDAETENSAASLVDSQSAAQSNGHLVQDEHNNNWTSATETDNSDDSVTENSAEDSAASLIDSHSVAQSNRDFVKDGENNSAPETDNFDDSETAKHDVECESHLTTISDSGVDLITENSGQLMAASELISDSKMEDDGDELLDTPPDTAVSVLVVEELSEVTESPEIRSDDKLECDDGDESQKPSVATAVSILVMENASEAVEAPEVTSDGELEYDGGESLEESSDKVVSLEDREADNSEQHAAHEDDDLVKLIPQSDIAEEEPVPDGEASCDSVNDLVALELALVSNTVNEASPYAVTQAEQSDGDVHSIDISEGADPEENALIRANLNSVEISTPRLSLLSAAASLPHPSEALTGGEDAYFVCQNWFSVADGVGQWSFGGINKGLYAQEFIQNFGKLVLNCQSAGLTNIKELLQQSASMTQSAGSARVLIAHFDNQVLHVANIGDSGFVIIRNGSVFKKSHPMVHEFNFPYAIGAGDDPVEAIEEYHVELEDGDMIVTATDGLFDNLYDKEIASVVSKSVEAKMGTKEMAELLALRAQEAGRSTSARTPFADAAQAAGQIGYSGGKLDHVTVIVSLVQMA